MNQAERSIDINLPVQTAYNQWTQFEEFPRFIAGISRVEQGQQTDLQWVSDGGREWRASLRRLIPDKVMAWRCEEGDGFSATLVFQELGPERTRIHLRTDQSAAQSKRAGAADLTEKDLGRFKSFIEERGVETGAWRAEILNGRVRHVAPIMDSVPAPEQDQIRFEVTPL